MTSIAQPEALASINTWVNAVLAISALGIGILLSVFGFQRKRARNKAEVSCAQCLTPAMTDIHTALQGTADILRLHVQAIQGRQVLEDERAREEREWRQRLDTSLQEIAVNTRSRP